MTRFTVLLPLVRPPLLLPFAIDSVLAQSIADFELFVVGDGAPPETMACAEDYARRDTRVKVRAFPKGERHGEAHRHQVLAGASGRYVAQLADDDLWLPNHLEELEALLSAADFGHLLHVDVRPNGRVEILPGDLASPTIRRRMLSEKFNVFGPTFAGYRLDAYRRLTDGWAPAPLDIWTDLHMWRKFLGTDGLTFATRAAVTAVHFAASERADFTPERRRDELRRCWEQVQDPRGRSRIVEAAWHSLLDRALQREDELVALATAHGELTSAHDAELARVTAARDEVQADLERMSRARDELTGELERVTAARTALDTELTRTTRSLVTTEGDLSLVLGSRSWRMTAPLRRIAAFARRRLPR